MLLVDCAKLSKIMGIKFNSVARVVSAGLAEFTAHP